MAIGTNLSYTYDGLLTTDVILKPTLTHPSVQMFFPNYMPNVVSSWQIPLIGNLNGMVRAYTGCGNTDPGKQLTIFNRTLTVNRLQVFFEQCPADFDGTVFEIWQRTGNDINDLTGTEFEKLINALLVDVAKRDIFRLVTLGDTAHANAEMNSVDGLWKLLIDGVAAYCVTRVANLVSLGNGTLASGIGLEIIRELTDKAPRLLRQVPPTEKMIATTEHVFNSLVASYESNSSGSDSQFKVLQEGPTQADGSRSLMYRGIKVVEVLSWSQAIEDYSLGFPHRTVYFAPGNNWLGSERRNIDGIDTMVWYDKDSDKNKFRSRFKLGVQYAHCQLAAVSY